MKLAVTGLAALCLSACDKIEQPNSPAARHGRYVGVGTYPAGQLWSKMVVANRPANAAAATMADDQQIIVVVDSLTGEIRECGDLTGYCIGMNPWRAALSPAQSTPVGLSAHASDLADGAERASADGAPADSTKASPAKVR
jgi:hypothetical protein